MVVKPPNDFSETIKKKVMSTPIGMALVLMAYNTTDKNSAVEMICMIAEIELAEKRNCVYCKTEGHYISDCPTQYRIRLLTSGDRQINKMRGKKSN